MTPPAVKGVGGLGSRQVQQLLQQAVEFQQPLALECLLAQLPRAKHMPLAAAKVLLELAIAKHMPVAVKQLLLHLTIATQLTPPVVSELLLRAGPGAPLCGQELLVLLLDATTISGAAKRRLLHLSSLRPAPTRAASCPCMQAVGCSYPKATSFMFC